MKNIKNEITEITTADGVRLTRFDLFRTVVDVSPAGLLISDMRKRMRIIDILQSDAVNIEDADFELLKKCFEEFRWGKVHKDIIAAADYLQSL